MAVIAFTWFALFSIPSSEAHSGDPVSTYVLTINRTGQGKVQVTPPSITVTPTWEYSYSSGTSVLLHAVPNSGYEFARWEGDGTGAVDRSVTMTANKEVTAVFRPSSRRILELDETNGDGMVEVHENITSGKTYMLDPQCEKEYPNGISLSLTAEPKDGYGFVRWEGDIGSNDPVDASIVIVMDSDKKITAVWCEGPGFITLSVNSVGKGKVMVDPPTQEFVEPPFQYKYLVGQDAEDVSLTLSASPMAGWQFVKWTGAASGTNAETDIVISDDATVTAEFEQTDWKVNVSANVANAKVKTTTQYNVPVTIPYNATTTDSFLAIPPSAGWIFSHWEGDLTGAKNPSDLVIDGDKSISEVFHQTGKDYATVEIRYSAFISPPGLLTSGGFFSGDNRGFRYGGGARSRITGKFSLDPARSEPAVGAPTESHAVSRIYWGIFDTHNHKCNDLFRYRRIGPAICSGWGSGDLSMVSGPNSGGAIAVAISIDGHVGCLPASAAINAYVTVELRQQIQADGTLGPVEYKLSGSHDGFPWHEIYLNRKLVYKFDPCIPGNSLTQLWPPVDEQIEGSDWQPVPGQ